MKIFRILVLILILLVLTGCGRDNTIAIEDFKWTFSHVQTEDGTVTFCKEAFSDTFQMPYRLLQTLPLWNQKEYTNCPF